MTTGEACPTRTATASILDGVVRGTLAMSLLTASNTPPPRDCRSFQYILKLSEFIPCVRCQPCFSHSHNVTAKGVNIVLKIPYFIIQASGIKQQTRILELLFSHILRSPPLELFSGTSILTKSVLPDSEGCGDGFEDGETELTCQIDFSWVVLPFFEAVNCSEVVVFSSVSEKKINFSFSTLQ